MFNYCLENRLEANNATPGRGLGVDLGAGMTCGGKGMKREGPTSNLMNVKPVVFIGLESCNFVESSQAFILSSTAAASSFDSSETEQTESELPRL